MKTDADAYRRLIDIGIALSAEKDIDSLLERILAEAKTMVSADAGTLYLVNSQKQLKFTIVLIDKLGISQGGNSGVPITLPAIDLIREDGQPHMTHIAAMCANLGEPLTIEDVYKQAEIDSTGARRFDEITGYRSQSFLTVPLKNMADETIGVLQLINATEENGKIGPFSNEAIPLIEALASQASVALENRHLLDAQSAMQKRLEQEVDERTKELKNALAKLSKAHIILKDLTTIDPVTGIRNRQYFEDVFDQEWRRAIRQHYPITLMLLDIDFFKQVNDTYGHLAGDECLATVAQAIDSLFNRPSDVVARYGGEEFVVILPYVEEENSSHMAEQVRAHIERSKIVADGHEIKVTISIGSVTMLPKEGMNQRELISRADKAMYRAKSQGRNRVCVDSEV